jgi:hypothetical protein
MNIKERRFKETKKEPFYIIYKAKEGITCGIADLSI